ncbi:hypothetical protein UPYG_G00203900 [Umbra pygmaea]|uniref:Uncharacterized protein n=1 Tax=Umbra pygmaea TaxID=75934 RepID=A0ABD0X6N7_UMBPY
MLHGLVCLPSWLSSPQRWSLTELNILLLSRPLDTLKLDTTNEPAFAEISFSNTAFLNKLTLLYRVIRY